MAYLDAFGYVDSHLSDQQNPKDTAPNPAGMTGGNAISSRVWRDQTSQGAGTMQSLTQRLNAIKATVSVRELMSKHYTSTLTLEELKRMRPETQEDADAVSWAIRNFDALSTMRPDDGQIDLRSKTVLDAYPHLAGDLSYVAQTLNVTKVTKDEIVTARNRVQDQLKSARNGMALVANVVEKLSHAHLLFDLLSERYGVIPVDCIDLQGISGVDLNCVDPVQARSAICYLSRSEGARLANIDGEITYDAVSMRLQSLLTQTNLLMDSALEIECLDYIRQNFYELAALAAEPLPSQPAISLKKMNRDRQCDRALAGVLTAYSEQMGDCANGSITKRELERYLERARDTLFRQRSVTPDLSRRAAVAIQHFDNVLELHQELLAASRDKTLIISREGLSAVQRSLVVDILSDVIVSAKPDEKPALPRKVVATLDEIIPSLLSQGEPRLVAAEVKLSLNERLNESPYRFDVQVVSIPHLRSGKTIQTQFTLRDLRSSETVFTHYHAYDTPRSQFSQ